MEATKVWPLVTPFPRNLEKGISLLFSLLRSPFLWRAAIPYAFFFSFALFREAVKDLPFPQLPTRFSLAYEFIVLRIIGRGRNSPKFNSCTVCSW